MANKRYIYLFIYLFYIVRKPILSTFPMYTMQQKVVLDVVVVVAFVAKSLRKREKLVAIEVRK